MGPHGYVVAAFRRIIGSQLIRSTATYAVADAINKAIPFILLPLIARYLSPADYGLLTNFSVLSQILLAFCALNTYSALNVSFFKLGPRGLSSYLSNFIYLIAALALLCLIASVVLSGTITRYFGLSRSWQLVALFAAASTAVSTLYASLLRMQSKAFRFSAFQVSQSLLSATLAVAFVVGLEWNWQGRALSLAAAPAGAMVFSIWMLRRDERLFSPVSVAEIRDAFTFGLPLLPHTLSFWLKTGMVKLIIANELGLAANGIYSLALTLGSVVGVFTDAFFSAYAPSMYRELTKLDALGALEARRIKATLVRNTYAFAVVMLALCLGGWLIMSRAIPLLFPRGYQDAVGLVPLVFLALYFDGLYSIVSGYVFYRRETTRLGAITFSSSVLQVALAFVLVRAVGLVGALYAGCLVSLLTFLAVLTQANRLYDLPWRRGRSA